MSIYHLTARQLSQLLNGTIEMFKEYHDLHDKNSEEAQTCAVNEALKRLDAAIERHLIGLGASSKWQQVRKKEAK